MYINKNYHINTMFRKIKWMLPVLLFGMCTAVNAKLIEDTEKGYNRFQLDYNGTWWTGSATGMGGSQFQKTAPVTNDKDLFWGFDATYLRGIRLTKSVPLFLEVGASLVYSSIDNEESNPLNALDEDRCDVTVRMLSFEVPVFLTYRFKFENGFHVSPFIGAKFRANAMMRLAYMKSVRGEKFETNNLFDTESYTYDGEEFSSKYRRFQACGEVGVNFGYKMLNLKLSYFYNSPIYKGEDTSHADLSCAQQGIIAGVGVVF
jgi:hypothetical protein